MASVEAVSESGVCVIRLNRPERLNALGKELLAELRSALVDFDQSDDDVAVITGTGRAFCVGEDLKESAAEGVPTDSSFHDGDPYGISRIEKPFIAAVNGFAMGGGFMLAAGCDFRISVPDAIYEVSEVKRWHLGGFSHGYAANLPHAISTELAFGFRLDARRLYDVGYLNRLADPGDLISTALTLAQQLRALPPAARQNTLRMMRAMQPVPPPHLGDFAQRLRRHGADSDLLEARRAFAEKRTPKFKGWDDPQDRWDGPALTSP